MKRYLECGETWAESYAIQDALRDHDAQHSYDPELYQGECEICAERVHERNLALERSINVDAVPYK